MSGSVWKSSVATLGDYIKHLREDGSESDKPCVACESPESDCDGGHHVACHICFDTGYDSTGYACSCTESNTNGWIKCPDSGRICSTASCPNGCKGDGDTEGTTERKQEGGEQGREACVGCIIPCGSPYNCKCIQHSNT